MTVPTQEQIDKLVKRAKNVLCDYSSTAVTQDYSIKKLRAAVEPFTKPQRIPILPEWKEATFEIKEGFANILFKIQERIRLKSLPVELVWEELRTLTAKESES